MTWLPIERAAQGLGRPLARLSAAAATAGALALLAGIASGRAGAALAALQGGWLFFAGLAAGSVAFAAAVRVARGEWAGALLPVACAGARFFGPAFAILAVLALGAGAIAPRGAEAGAARLASFAARQLLAGALVFVLGARFVAMARSPAAGPSRVRAAGGAYLVAYAIGLSLWALGFVMEPAGHPALAIVPAYYFLGAFLSGIAWVALVAALRDLSGPEARHDLGKLLFGFVALWSYLLWSLFLPTWYGNVPGESAILLARWTGAYEPVAVAVLAAVSAGPLAVLLPERSKRRRGTLAIGAASILLGLWAERYLLVLPSLRIQPDPWNLPIGMAVTAGVAGLFLLSVGAGLREARSAPGHGPPPA